MNHPGPFVIAVFLFTASVVCQDNTTDVIQNATEITTTKQENITTTTTTTTVAPPTTTESPMGNWTVANGTGTICIWVVMAAKFNVPYNTTNGTAMSILDLDPKATVSDKSSCDDGILVLEFGKNNLSFTFTHDDKKVSLANITLGVFMDNKTFPNGTTPGAHTYTSFNNKLFEASTGMSYLCKVNTEVPLSGDVKMELQNLQLEAFRTKEQQGFSTAEECLADEGDVSDIVPIAVGCALAGLVVIVLIAYLVGRRHKRQKGYESV